MSLLKYLLVSLLFLLALPIPAFAYNQTLNNVSQTVWNESFTVSENKTFWITLPKSSSVYDAKLNLSGIKDATDINNDTEYSFGCVGQFHPSDPCENGVDENWGTSARLSNAGTSYLYENYSTPGYVAINWTWSGMANAVSLWVAVNCYNYTSSSWVLLRNITNVGILTYNETLPSGCTSVNPLQIRTDITNDGSLTANYYEGKAVIEIGNITNPYLDVSGDGDKEWDFTGEFNHTNNRTANFSSELNTWLSTCSQDANGDCNASFILHSDTAGKLQVSNINIAYRNTTNAAHINLTAGDVFTDTSILVTFPTTVTATCWSESTCSLYYDNSLVTSPDTRIAATGTHTYKSNASLNANYSANSTGIEVTVQSRVESPLSGAGGGGGGGIRYIERLICELGYNWSDFTQKCELPPMEQLAVKPPIFNLEALLLNPMLGPFSPFHLFLFAIGAVVTADRKQKKATRMIALATVLLLFIFILSSDKSIGFLWERINIISFNK